MFFGRMGTSYLSLNTAKFSARDHTFWSLAEIPLSIDADCSRSREESRSSGAFRDFHMSSMPRKRSMSALKTLSKTF